MKRKIFCLSIVWSCLFIPAVFSPPGFCQERTWTDITGKFQVEATLIQFDGKTVKLEKPDGLVVTLPLSKLSKEDQDFLKAQKDSDNPFAGGTEKSSAKSSPSGSKTISGDMKGADELFIGNIPDKWMFKPPKSSAPSGFKPLPCAVPSGKQSYLNFESPLFFTSEGKGLAFIYHKSGFGNDQENILYAFQLATGKSKAYKLPEEVKFWGPSPDGKRFLATPNSISDRKGKTRIDIYTFDAEKVTKTGAFIPYAQLKEEYKRDVEWACWVDDNMILTLNSSEKLLCLWNLKTGKAVYSMPVSSPPTLSYDRKTMVATSDKEAVLCDVMTGKVLGRLIDEKPFLSKFTFSPDSKRLLGLVSGNLLIWNLETGEEIRSIVMNGGFETPYWINEEMVLLNDRLIDTETGVPLCYYSGATGMKNGFFAGRYWYFVKSGDRTILASAVIPQPGIEKARKEINIPEQFLLYPGAKLKLVLELNNLADDKVLRSKIEESLKEKGFEIDDNSPLKLTAKIWAKDPEDVTYGAGGHFPFRGGASVDLKIIPYVSEYFLQMDGKTYWHHGIIAKPGVVPMKKDQTLQDAAKEVNLPDTDFFVEGWFPKYVLKKEHGIALIDAELTPDGVR